MMSRKYGYWLILLHVLINFLGYPESFAQAPLSKNQSPSASKPSPVELTADSLDYDQMTELYIAEGSVEIVHRAQCS